MVHVSLKVCSPAVSGLRVCARTGRMLAGRCPSRPGEVKTPLEIPSHRVVTLACAGTLTPIRIFRCSPGATAKLGGGPFFGNTRGWPFTATVSDSRIGTVAGCDVGAVPGPLNAAGTATAMAATASTDPATSPVILARRRRIRPVRPSMVKRGALAWSAATARCWRSSCSSRTICFALRLLALRGGQPRGQPGHRLAQVPLDRSFPYAQCRRELCYGHVLVLTQHHARALLRGQSFECCQHDVPVEHLVGEVGNRLGALEQ